MEEKNINTENGKTCCSDGNCSICKKEAEILNSENSSTSFKNDTELKSDKEEHYKIIEEKIIPQKIQSERDKIAYAFSKDTNNNYSKEEKIFSDYKSKDDLIIKEIKMEEKNNFKKQKSNGFLIFILFILVIALAVAGYFLYDFYKKLNGPKSKVDSFDKTAKIVEDNGKTWVSYDEKRVVLEVYYSENCGEKCSGDEEISFLQSKIPTLEIKKIDVDKTENKDLNYVPYFVLDSNLAQTNFYTEAKDLFTEKNGKYVFDAVEVGFSVGKQLTNLSKEGFLIGEKNAKVEVVAIVDFSSEKSAISQAILNKLETEYKGKVSFIYKIITNTEDEKLKKISLASFCADDQKGFASFSKTLFDRQQSWLEFTGDINSVLENYAVSSKLNKANFSDCLNNEKFVKDIEKMNEEIKNYGITGVPVYFVNNERIDGVQTYEGMKKLIDTALTNSANTDSDEKDKENSTNSTSTNDEEN